MAKKEKNPPFELALEKLENLVEKMESGEATLEQSLEWFEEGMGLIKSCRLQLEKAEQKVQTLIKDSGGKLSLKEIE
ncbi:uncharacterized protein METZ01_LOCUS171944 [marine metagenome]|uniref:Uncharacterized protein n=1 Tax=marine metagenome TaxID=408172 RepID=A0A382BZ53_9ZZZZ